MDLPLKERITLEEIAGGPSFFIWDTSFYSMFGQSLLDHLDSISSEQELDRDILLHNLGETQNLIRILSGNERAIVPQKVFDEENVFNGILRHHLKKYGITGYSPNGGSFLRDSFQRAGMATPPESTPSLFARASANHSALCKMLSKRAFSYDEGDQAKDFKDFHSLLVSYSSIMGLKKRKAHPHPGAAGHEWNDEHIIATGIYFLLLNRRPVSFCSHDIDFPTILAFLNQALFSPTFTELASHTYFQNLHKAIQQCPALHYYAHLDEKRAPFLTQTISYNSFLMRGPQLRAVKDATFKFYMKRRQIFADDPSVYVRNEQPKSAGNLR